MISIFFPCRFENVRRLVNKRCFYKLLAEMQIPNPKTYFPENNDDYEGRSRIYFETNFHYLCDAAKFNKHFESHSAVVFPIMSRINKSNYSLFAFLLQEVN